MTDYQLTQVIRHLLASEKPSGITPLDVLLVVRLLLQHAAEKAVTLSYSSLGEQLCCTDRTVATSVQRLVEHGWLTFRSGKNQNTANTFFVVLDKLPLDAELKRTVVSPFAKGIAAQHIKLMKSAKRRVFKTTADRLAFGFQSLIDKRCNGDATLLTSILNFAGSHPDYKAKLLRGPHEIKRCWRSLVDAYRRAEAAQAQQAQQEIA
jgi:hypothetical protein